MKSKKPKPMQPTDEPLAIVEWEFACHAPAGFIGRDASPEALADCEHYGSIPCGGSGGVGPWCEGCRFLKDGEI